MGEQDEEEGQTDDITIGDANVVRLNRSLADAIVALFGTVDRGRRFVGSRFLMLSMTDLDRTAYDGAEDQEVDQEEGSKFAHEV